MTLIVWGLLIGIVALLWILVLAILQGNQLRETAATESGSRRYVKAAA